MAESAKIQLNAGSVRSLPPWLMPPASNAIVVGFTMEASGSYLVAMRSVGLKILKNRLSEYVRIAANGEVVLVTDRDVVVAEITPPNSSRTLNTSDALLAESVRNGWVTPATLPQSTVPTRKPVTKFKRLMRELVPDRTDP